MDLRLVGRRALVAGSSSGVGANTVGCGVVLTENTEKVMLQQARQLGYPETGMALEARVAAEMWPVPVGRMARPEEIGAAVCFPCSPRADFITGAHLRVDGGAAGWVN